MKKNDIIKTIFLLTALIFVGYYIILIDYVKPKPTNSITIINNTNYNLNPPTNLILKNVLHIDSVSIKFEYMEDKYTEKYQAFIVEDFFFKHHYVIFMSKYLRGNKIGMVLAHELVHLDQFESGDLIQLNFYGGIYIYKGDTINTNIVEYIDRSYEIDAFNREEETYYRIFKSLYK